MTTWLGGLDKKEEPTNHKMVSFNMGCTLMGGRQACNGILYPSVDCAL